MYMYMLSLRGACGVLVLKGLRRGEPRGSGGWRATNPFYRLGTCMRATRDSVQSIASMASSRARASRASTWSSRPLFDQFPAVLIVEILSHHDARSLANAAIICRDFAGSVADAISARVARCGGSLRLPRPGVGEQAVACARGGACLFCASNSPNEHACSSCHVQVACRPSSE